MWPHINYHVEINEGGHFIHIAVSWSFIYSDSDELTVGMLNGNTACFTEECALWRSGNVCGGQVL